MKLGTREILNHPIDVPEKYLELAKQDEEAAIELQRLKFYNQSGYFYIQAMEKYIKSHITEKIDATNPYFAEKLSKTLGHSLDESLSLLVEVYAANDNLLADQMNKQIYNQILQGIRFGSLHNKLRYPSYSSRFNNYSALKFSESDSKQLNNLLGLLKKYLSDLHRV